MCSAHSLYSYTDCTRYNLTTLLSPLPRLVTVESVNITLFSCQAINLAVFFFFSHSVQSAGDTHPFSFPLWKLAPVCALDKMTEDLICARFQI